MNRPVITLTTDFGHGPFAGIMKGVMLGLCPDALFIDICHTVAPQDIMAGALVLEQAMGAFEPGTVHLAVVDPGVGTSRRPIAVKALGMYFVGPDNGLFSTPLTADPEAQVWLLENDKYFRKPVSATFHGRDVFSPCAARLARGLEPSEFGPLISDPVILAIPKARQTATEISGEIIAVDDFGNLASNITADMLEEVLAGMVPEVVLHLPGETLIVSPISKSYCTVTAGGVLAVINSMGRLELGLNHGSLAGHIIDKAADPRGLRVTVKPCQD